MLKVLIITHGQLGEGILRTAEGIVGKQEDTVIVNLAPHEGLASLCEKIGAIINDTDDATGLLVLTDMLGGTPCNACLPFCSTKNIEVVSGINLYMLLSAFINRKNMHLKDLTNRVMADGKKSITNAKDIFLKKLK